MQDFNTLLINRRSYRKYTSEPLSGDSVQLILEAALLSPTSKNKHSWEFVVVEDKETLTKLSNCKAHSATFVADAALAVVVLGNPLESDVWVEDASIAAINMQLQAEELEIGSCWVQVRGREFSETVTSGEYINDVLDVPMPLEVLCIIAFGKKEKQRSPNSVDNLLWEKVHIGKF
ncbi:MAG: nitroreductase family protein [Bacteroidia bacterium]|nr:nitroreductase family protein [Bacteroidia bacterium]